MDYNDDDIFKDNDDGFPKRTETIYKNIEKFEPYELTHCVMFEMAVRNKEVKQILHVLKSIKLVQNQVDEMIKPDIEVLNTSQTIKPKVELPESTLIKYREYESIYENLIKILKDDYYLYFDQQAINIPEIENPLNKKISGMSTEEIKEEILDALKSPILKHISHNISEYLSKNIYYDYYKSDHNIYDGFTTVRGIDRNCSTFSISSINTHFKRKIYDTNQINVALNMTLPEEELVAYIKHIKNILSHDDAKELKSPNTLLEKDTKKVQQTKNFPKKKTALKLANMFFVYDYVTARLDDYSSNEQDRVINEIFDEMESVIPTAYYLEKINKEYLDTKDNKDNIFQDLVSPLYKEDIRLVQRKYKKATIHTKIDDVCKVFKKYLNTIEISVIHKKYSKKIDNTKDNKIFEDLDTILYNKYIENLHKKYSHIEKIQREKLFKDIKIVLEEYKISSSTASNYYYALKPYIEECRYPEFLTGESIIEDTE